MSGRSSRSTLMLTNVSFISAATIGSSKDSCCHDVAPVAGGVADGEEDRLVFLARLGERLLAPGIPVDRVVGVLEEVRALLGGEVVLLRGCRGRLPRIAGVGHAGSKENDENNDDEVGSHAIENHLQSPKNSVVNDRDMKPAQGVASSHRQSAKTPSTQRDFTKALRQCCHGRHCAPSQTAPRLGALAS